MFLNKVFILAINKKAFRLEGYVVCFVSVYTISFQSTGGPNSLHERGRDSCLRAVLCYKRLFTTASMRCKRFLLKERKNVMFLNKVDVPYGLVVFFVVCLPCLSFSSGTPK